MVELPRSIGAFSCELETQTARIAFTQVRSCAWTCGYTAGAALRRRRLGSASSECSRRKLGVNLAVSIASCSAESSTIQRPVALYKVLRFSGCAVSIASRELIRSAGEIESIPTMRANCELLVEVVATLPHLQLVCALVSTVSITMFASHFSLNANACAANLVSKASSATVLMFVL